MIEWFMWVQVVIALAAGVFCIGMGLAKQPPNDFTIGSSLLVELLLVVQLVIAIVAPFVGGEAAGDVVEFYAYLLTALVMVPLAGFWALMDRTRWSNLILGVVNLAIAVMVYRMFVVWFAL